jgi:vancomycin resistance protein YoaR
VVGQHQWPETHSEQTDVLAPVMVTPSDEPTTVIPRLPGQRKGLRRTLIVAGAVVGALGVVYAIDLLLSSGDVPRGVTVAGVDVGGMDKAAAEQALHRELDSRMAKPLDVKIGDAAETLDPAKAGLKLDWAATLEQAGSQPLNPITRLTSLFTTREVGVITSRDDSALNTAIEGLRTKTAREPKEGGITFEGANPVAVQPQSGQQLDVDAARQKILDNWLNGAGVELPVKTTPVKLSADAVNTALEQIVKPAVSGPVIVKGEGKDATLEPAAIAGALVIEPGDGALNVRLDQAKVVAAVQPQLASTEKEGKDAAIVFEGGMPTVQPSQDGKAVNWDGSFGGLMDVLKKTSAREVKAQYATKPAKVTTDQANQLGIKEVVSEFTTAGFAADSGKNIRQVATKVNGAIVKPGETFSLNGFTGPRTAAQGYVEAGVIKDGAPGREVGGGISQFATTLYNASYFAGMKDAGHKEHSYYISRYPAAREATVFQNPSGASVIDLKFTNDTQTGVAIQTIWTPSNITVRLWGTKQFIVDSIPGERTSFVEPQEKPGPAQNCSGTGGIRGFTTSDTRVIKDLAGKELRRNTRTVHYNAQPKIICPPPA